MRSLLSVFLVFAAAALPVAMFAPHGGVLNGASTQPAAIVQTLV